MRTSCLGGRCGVSGFTQPQCTQRQGLLFTVRRTGHDPWSLGDPLLLLSRPARRSRQIPTGRWQPAAERDHGDRMQRTPSRRRESGGPAVAFRPAYARLGPQPGIHCVPDGAPEPIHVGEWWVLEPPLWSRTTGSSKVTKVCSRTTAGSGIHQRSDRSDESGRGGCRRIALCAAEQRGWLGHRV